MTLAPRVQVFTHLSCNQLYHHQSLDLSDHPFIFNPDYHNGSYVYSDPAGPAVLSFDSVITPSANRCASDPAVQSRAARLQTIMVTTMGIMSALTTGWWSHFGERHGRLRALVASTLGLLITDLVFCLVSTPHSPWARHAQILFVIAPFFEGLLGGWSTLQAAISAYISDCTADGSRAQVFSRMSGVSFLGLAFGPAIGAFLMRHPLFSLVATHPNSPMTSVFQVAVFCSFVNLLLLFVYPESLNTKQVEKGATISDNNKPSEGFFKRLSSPLAIFLPKVKTVSNGRKHRDWNLPLLASGSFAALFTMGIYQIKYLYAEHIYNWSAEQLSYYISLVGTLRAIHLLLVMPFIISIFKPKPTSAPINGKTPKPSPAQLVREIKFDLTLVRLSLVVEVLSHVLVALSPQGSSDLLFVVFTTLPSFGSGSLPAANSLALSMMKLNGDTDTGKIFGAFAMLQSVAQMILGPLAFGLIYSITVAKYPKAIFVMAASTGMIALLSVIVIQPRVAKRKAKVQLDIERGRSRVSKDLRSGLGVCSTTNGEELL